MIAGIIQARMGSTRLPGKTLLPLAGKPLLSHVIERVRASRLLDVVIVATTVRPVDDAVAAHAESLGVEAYRGSEDDVLDRYYQAADRISGLKAIVRITADDAMKDPAVIDRVIARFQTLEGKIDYVSNWLEPSYPEGLDVEVFTMAALQQAWQDARLPSQREHVTPYIWMQPEKFRLENVRYHRDFSHLRWTVDTQEDLDFAAEVYGELYHGTPFGLEDVLDLLSRRPDLVVRCRTQRRHEAFWRSVVKERMPQ